MSAVRSRASGPEPPADVVDLMVNNPHFGLAIPPHVPLAKVVFKKFISWSAGVGTPMAGSSGGRVVVKAIDICK